MKPTCLFKTFLFVLFSLSLSCAGDEEIPDRTAQASTSDADQEEHFDLAKRKSSIKTRSALPSSKVDTGVVYATDEELKTVCDSLDFHNQNRRMMDFQSVDGDPNTGTITCVYVLKSNLVDPNPNDNWDWDDTAKIQCTSWGGQWVDEGASCTFIHKRDPMRVCNHQIEDSLFSNVSISALGFNIEGTQVLCRIGGSVTVE